MMGVLLVTFTKYTSEQFRPYRSDMRFIEGYREGFKQILNWWEFALARFEARPSCT